MVEPKIWDLRKMSSLYITKGEDLICEINLDQPTDPDATTLTLDLSYRQLEYPLGGRIYQEIEDGVFAHGSSIFTITAKKVLIVIPWATISGWLGATMRLLLKANNGSYSWTMADFRVTLH